MLCTCKVVIKPTCIATWAFCFFLLSLDLKVPTAGGFYNPAKTSIPSRGSCNTPRCFMLLKLGQAVAAQIFLACACLKLSCIFFLQVFELLLTFCSVTGLRNLVCKALFSIVSSRPKDPKRNSAFDVVLYWASQSVDIHSTVSLKALDFIKEIYEVRMRILISYKSLINVP